MPRVSVLMPVYNSAAYVEEALTSVAGQQFGDFELIVVNDGSSDGSAEILTTFCTREPRMRLISRPNQGLIATRNELLAEACGDLIAWMDSDDISHPERLRCLVAALDADPTLVCVGSNTRTIDPEGKYLGDEKFPEDHADIRAAQESGGGFRFPSTMQRRSAAKAVGGFREPFKIGEDFDYLLRLAEQGRVANLPTVLYFYRQHLSSTVTALGVDWPRHRDVILALAHERRTMGSDRLQRGENVSVPRTTPHAARKYASAVLISWANGALHCGDRPRAIRYTIRAIRTAPFNVSAWRLLAKIALLPLLPLRPSHRHLSRAQETN